MHDEAFNFCKIASVYIEDKIGDFSNVNILDVGGRNVNGSIHQFFKNANIKTVDIINDIGVDFNVDFSDANIVSEMRFADKFDICISTEVFEHTPNWRTIIDNMIKSTSSGGWILITCATIGRPRHSAIDGHQLSDSESEYYQNVSEEDFIDYISNCPVSLLLFEINDNPNDLYALLQKD